MAPIYDKNSLIRPTRYHSLLAPLPKNGKPSRWGRPEEEGGRARGKERGKRNLKEITKEVEEREVEEERGEGSREGRENGGGRRS